MRRKSLPSADAAIRLLHETDGVAGLSDRVRRQSGIDATDTLRISLDGMRSAHAAGASPAVSPRVAPLPASRSAAAAGLATRGDTSAASEWVTPRTSAVGSRSLRSTLSPASPAGNLGSLAGPLELPRTGSKNWLNESRLAENADAGSGTRSSRRHTRSTRRAESPAANLNSRSRSRSRLRRREDHGVDDRNGRLSTLATARSAQARRAQVGSSTPSTFPGIAKVARAARRAELWMPPEWCATGLPAVFAELPLTSEDVLHRNVTVQVRPGVKRLYGAQHSSLHVEACPGWQAKPRALRRARAVDQSRRTWAQLGQTDTIGTASVVDTLTRGHRGRMSARSPIEQPAHGPRAGAYAQEAIVEVSLEQQRQWRSADMPAILAGDAPLDGKFAEAVVEDAREAHREEMFDRLGADWDDREFFAVDHRDGSPDDDSDDWGEESDASVDILNDA